MSLVATDSGGATFTPAPAGTHLAICCQVIDLGHQFSKFYGKTKHKVLVGWELPDEHTEEGKPFIVWQRYTLSLHENSALRAILEAWRGKAFSADELKGFHLKNVLGTPCMVNIAHEENDGKTYARVKAVMKIPKGTIVPTLTAPKIMFDIEEWDAELFETFTDSLKKTIEASDERTKKKPAGNAPSPAAVRGAMADVAADEDDGIPF